MANQPKKAPDKLTLLTLDKLTMAEVVEFERMSGLTMSEAYAHQGDPHHSVIMALAYLTERRANRTAPGARKSFWERLPLSEFHAYFRDRFEFEELDDGGEDDGEDDTEDPTNAA